MRVKLVGRGKIEDGMGWWSEEGRMEWGDAGGRGICKKIPAGRRSGAGIVSVIRANCLAIRAGSTEN